MKLNGIKISERLLEGALINMLQVGRNAGAWAGTRYRYDVSQNYKTDDEYIDEDDFKLRITKLAYPHYIVAEAEFSKESEVYQRALARKAALDTRKEEQQP